MRRDGMSERELDAILRPAIVVEPPPDLQASLMALVAAEAPGVAARALAPVAEPTPSRAGVLAWGGFVVLTIALAIWQVVTWVLDSTLVLGDVREALVLVLSSPAGAFVGGLGLDLTSLGLWATVAVVGWLASRVLEPTTHPI